MASPTNALTYLCNLARYWLRDPWRWHKSVETCRSSIIICQLIVYCLFIVKIQNEKQKEVPFLNYSTLRTEALRFRLSIYQSTRCNSSEDLHLQNRNARKWEIYKVPFCFPHISTRRSWDLNRASIVISFTCYIWRNLLLCYWNITSYLMWHRHLWGNILFREGIFGLLSKFSYPWIGITVICSYNRIQYGCWVCMNCIIYIIWNILLIFTGALNTQEVTYIYFIRIISHLCAYVACVKSSAYGKRRVASMLWIESFAQTQLSILLSLTQQVCRLELFTFVDEEKGYIFLYLLKNIATNADSLKWFI